MRATALFLYFRKNYKSSNAKEDITMKKLLVVTKEIAKEVLAQLAMALSIGVLMRYIAIQVKALWELLKKVIED